MSGICLNEDNSHYFMSRGNHPDKMTESGLRELIDHYVSPQVKEIIFNVNCMRAGFASSTIDPIWKDVEERAGIMYFRGKPLSKNFVNFVLGAKKLADANINPYVFWLEETRKRGISPWISMRMNDVHNAFNEDDLLHSDWWREHPEARRCNYRALEWIDCALDYEQENVRKKMSAFIEECFKLYDMDGFELDWTRFCGHFKPGREAHGAKLLNNFMQEVCTLAQEWSQRRGHEIKLGVRIPSRPETADKMGLDVITWVDAGWVDMVVAAPFWLSTDSDIPIKLWRRLLGNKVTLAAGLELHSRPYPAAEPITNTAAIVMANATNYLDQGADRIYLFNYMDSETCVDNPNDQKEILHIAGNLERAANEPRRHLVTYPDITAPGQYHGIALPRQLNHHSWIDLRLAIGPQPTAGTAQVVLGFTGNEGTDYHAVIEIRVNEIHATPCIAPDFAISGTATTRAAWEIPAEVLQHGDNVIRIHVSGEAEATLIWCELDTNYHKINMEAK